MTGAPMIGDLDHFALAFDAAAAGGRDALRHAVVGLRTILIEVGQPTYRLMTIEEVRRLSSSIFAAAPVIAEAAEPHLTTDAVHLGLSAATAFVPLLMRSIPPEDVNEAAAALYRDEADHMSLLADELDALQRRRSIEARGDLFRRSIAIRRALAATADDHLAH